MLLIKKDLKLLLAFYFVSFSIVAEVPGPPEIGVMDDTGINILSGLPSFNQTDIEIGSGVSKLTHTISSYDAGYFWNFQDNLTGYAGSQNGTVSRFGKLPGASPQRFNSNGSGGYVAANRNGATLVQQSGAWIYTAADGTKVTGNKTTYPNGFEVSVYFGDETTNPNTGLLSKRKISFVTNTGLQLLYRYGGNHNSNKKYHLPTSIIAINNAYEYCAPTTSLCFLAQSWPTSTYDWPEHDVMFATFSQGAANAQAVFKVTDAKGQITSYVHRRLPKNGPNNMNMSFPEFRDFDGNPAYVSRLTAIYNGPVSGQPIKQYTYENFVQRYPVSGGGPGSGGWRYELQLQLAKETSIGDAVWTYQYIQPDTPYRSTGWSYGPRGNTTALMANGGIVPHYLTLTAPGVRVEYEDNSINRVNKVNQFGFEYHYEYDTRGNITQRTQLGKDGAPDVILTAGYDSNCSNLKTCNKPNWTRDAKGNQTDYQYHAQSGQLLKVTGPADINGIRPQTRYTYTQKYAFYKNSSGSYVQATSPVWMLTREAYCKSSSATSTGCSAAGDEVVTTYDYGPNSGPNNLFLRGTTVTADGKSLTSCYDYDRFGNVIAETKPRANVVSCY